MMARLPLQSSSSESPKDEEHLYWNVLPELTKERPKKWFDEFCLKSYSMFSVYIEVFYERFGNKASCDGLLIQPIGIKGGNFWPTYICITDIDEAYK